MKPHRREYSAKDAGRFMKRVILLAVCLAGCARFEPQPISPARMATELDARRLDDEGLKEFLEQNLGHEPEHWPLKSWDLKALTLAAFYFHPTLDVARAQWRVAQAGARTAGGRPNPSLNLVPGYDFSAANGLSPWIPFFSVDVPLETAGKRGHRIARAQHLSESAWLNIATVAWQARSSVRAGLLDSVIADRRAALLEKQAAVQEQIVKLLEQRLAVGGISQPELTTARIALNRTRLDLDDTKAKRAEARMRLAESLGVSGSAPPCPPGPPGYSQRAGGLRRRGSGIATSNRQTIPRHSPESRLSIRPGRQQMDAGRHLRVAGAQPKPGPNCRSQRAPRGSRRPFHRPASKGDWRN